MDIILAGYNLDYETIKEFKESSPGRDNLTPETVSAAYARISRDPSPVNELRKTAREEVDKARKSNQNIVFGMGHSSVAEHAVFNIDIIGVSRLIVEEIEKFRLSSYTEKSQRYIRLEDDFVIPEEVRDAGLETQFINTIREQNKLYHELYSALKVYVFDKYQDIASDPANHSTLDGWAKEDARYIVSLATESQLGMTLNARNLELVLRRCMAHPLKEVNEYGRKLYEVTTGIAPSLVKYTEATPFESLTRNALRDKSNEMIGKYGVAETRENSIIARDHNVSLLYATPDADSTTVASLIHASSKLTMEKCISIVSRMDVQDRKDVIKTALQYMESYNAVSREFENVDLWYEITVSASCFGQLKRHRMATILSQDYDPSLGVTIPLPVQEVGMKNRFMEIIGRTEDTYNLIKDAVPLAAPYILTNAHRKKITIKTTARELYHISRLREDKHAQWDIRKTATRMVRLGKQVMPLTLMLAAGKDSFASLYKEVIT